MAVRESRARKPRPSLDAEGLERIGAGGEFLLPLREQILHGRIASAGGSGHELELQRERDLRPGPYDVVHPRAYLDRLAAAELRRPRGPVEWLAMGPEIVSTTLRRRLRRADK